MTDTPTDTPSDAPTDTSADTSSEPEGAAQGPSEDRKTRFTVLVALGANLLIAVAKAVGGLFAGSPALLSEAAHSVADSLNEVFLLAALRRSRRPADRQHPFGYGKERFFWSLLAAVGIFVMGGCFSFFQAYEAFTQGGAEESKSGFVVGLVVLGVAFLAEGTSLARAVHQVRKQPGEGIGEDPTLRTVLAEDATAVIGVVLAAAGLVLHRTTGHIEWEATASLIIGVLLVFVAYRLGTSARDQLIGEGDPKLHHAIYELLDDQPEIEAVAALHIMRLGMDSTLVAARVDLVPGLESEQLELVSERIKRTVHERWPEADQMFLDVVEAPTGEWRSPAESARAN
ncbi:cation diffusion facilitator family transporter [Streptomyces sp. PsTaAH-137]|uniref:cation diffusion facilitator family transporter n=1 Tax=Streptomyces sp. PsTaAH-137 TaxID=1305830 RepID=UPI0015ECAA37